MLAAATAAVFVCAPAGAIQITSTSPSGSYWDPSYVLEHTNNMVEIRTNIDFERVEWNFGGEIKKRDNGTENGTDTHSWFIPSLEGLGRPWGSKRAVTATAYGNDGTSVSETIWLNVWSASSYIDISNMSGPSDVVVGESLTVDLETNAGFERVDWYIGKAAQPSHSTYGPAYKASFTHTFGEGMGSDRENGEPRQIKAKAYALGSPDGDPVEPAEDAFTVNVHESKGKILRDTFAYVSYFDVEYQYDENGEVNSGLVDIGFTAGFYYYNDLQEAQAEVYAYVLACKRRRDKWGQLEQVTPVPDSFDIFHAPENVIGEYWYPEIEVAFDTVVSGHFEMENTLFERGTVRLPNLYYAYAKTEVHEAAGADEDFIVDRSEWKFDSEDQRIGADRTESKVFPDEWPEGFNFP